MIENLVTYIQSIINQYGAWGVFLGTLLEEIIAPIPSPIVSLAAGFFLLPATSSIVEIMIRAVLVIAIPVSVGISAGSVIVFALGYFGGKPVIEKTKKITGINWQDIQKIEEKMTHTNKDEIVLFFLRILPIIPGVAISGFCGVFRYSFKKFFIITFLGSFIRAFLLGLLGWQVGTLYANYAAMVTKFEKYILVAVLFLLILLLGKYFIIKKNKARAI